MIHSTETIFPAPRESETEKENSRENELARLVDSGNTRELLRFLTENDSDPFAPVEKKTRKNAGEKKTREKKGIQDSDSAARRYWKNIDNFVRREYGGVYPIALDKHLANIETWRGYGIDRDYAVRSLFAAWTYAGEIFRAKLGMMNYTPVFYRDRTDILPFTFDPAFFKRPGLRTEKNARKFMVKILHTGFDRNGNKIVSSQYVDNFPSMLSLFADGENDLVTVLKADNEGKWFEFACMRRQTWLLLGGQKNARNWRVVKKHADRYDIVSTSVFTDREISASYKMETEIQIVKGSTDKHARIVRVEKHPPILKREEFVKILRKRNKPSDWKLWMKNPTTYIARFARTPENFSAHKKVWQEITRETETETKVTRIYNETRRIENENPPVWDKEHPGWE